MREGCLGNLSSQITHMLLLKQMPETTLFYNQGYIEMPKLLDESELARIQAADPDRYQEFRQDREIHSLVGFDSHSVELDVLASSYDRVNRISALIGATSLKWISGYRIDKGPNTEALEWHQDWWAWNEPISEVAAPTQVALLVYLDETSEANGALRVIPGSHRNGRDLANSLPVPHDPANDHLPNDHRARLDLPGSRTMNCAPGDGVLLDYRLIHGTHANRTDFFRKAVLWSFTPHWDALPLRFRSHYSEHPCLDEVDDPQTHPSHVRNVLPQKVSGGSKIDINRSPQVFTATN